MIDRAGDEVFPNFIFPEFELLEFSAECTDDLRLSFEEFCRRLCNRCCCGGAAADALEVFIGYFFEIVLLDIFSCIRQLLMHAK